MLCPNKLMLKADLRKIYLTKLQSLAPAERFEKSNEIAEQFYQTFALEKIKILHLFLSIERNNEIQTSFIYQKIRKGFPNLKTVVPRINRETDEIESLEFNSSTQLSIKNWGIPEPIGNELTEAEKIDAVLVPLLCFDKKGFRVGYGKGFYDKFLKKCRKDCLKIGLSYFPPIDEISDINAFDVTLDYCVTPKKIWKY